MDRLAVSSHIRLLSAHNQVTVSPGQVTVSQGQITASGISSLLVSKASLITIGHVHRRAELVRLREPLARTSVSEGVCLQSDGYF